MLGEHALGNEVRRGLGGATLVDVPDALAGTGLLRDGVGLGGDDSTWLAR
jgi:hypothetical protein